MKGYDYLFALQSLCLRTISTVHVHPSWYVFPFQKKATMAPTLFDHHEYSTIEKKVVVLVLVVVVVLKVQVGPWSFMIDEVRWKVVVVQIRKREWNIAYYESRVIFNVFKIAWSLSWEEHTINFLNLNII